MGGLKLQDWEQLITEQWQLHYPESQYLLSMQDVKFIISVVRGFVVQGMDHAPDDLHVFCPSFCCQVLKNTFSDTKVYSSRLLSPAEALKFFYKARPLKNGSSHADGASTKLPQYPSPMFS